MTSVATPSSPATDGGHHPLPAELDTVIVPRSSDLGDGFMVRRALPHAQQRMVGPFVFFDEMGPAGFEVGHGLDVRPHPHIGLATVTYLYEGEILHRDSLDTVQLIRPGEVNWMTAGRGIVHSERTAPEARAQATRLAGLQVWVALPRQHEETAPAFAHHKPAELPVISDTGLEMRLILGGLAGQRSPVQVLSDMFYADVALQEGARLQLKPEHEERAVYVARGSVEIVRGGHTSGPVYGPQQMLVLKRGEEVVLRASQGAARLMLCGGEPMDGPRYVWWNFVSSSKDRIEQAKEDWAARRFAPVPQETEFIPLPQVKPAEVKYP